MTKDEAREVRKVINALNPLNMSAGEIDEAWLSPGLRAYLAMLHETIYQGQAKLNMERMFPSPRQVAGAEWLRTARFIRKGGCR